MSSREKATLKRLVLNVLTLVAVMGLWGIVPGLLSLS